MSLLPANLLVMLLLWNNIRFQNEPPNPNQLTNEPVPRDLIEDGISNGKSALRLESGQLAYRGDSALPSAFLRTHYRRDAFAFNEGIDLYLSTEASVQDVMQFCSLGASSKPTGTVVRLPKIDGAPARNHPAITESKTMHPREDVRA
jgi:hypothetical protein